MRYYVAVTRFNLSFSELKTMALASYEHSFAEAPLQAKLIAGYNEAITAFEKQFSRENWKQVCDRIPAITHGYGREVLGLKLG